MEEASPIGWIDSRSYRKHSGGHVRRNSLETKYTALFMESLEFALDKSGTTCQKLWVKMSPEQRLEAAHHFWDKGSEISHALKTVAVTAIAKHRSSRPISIRGASQEQISKWTSGTRPSRATSGRVVARYPTRFTAHPRIMG
jgi:hypothetical protein